MPRLAHKAEYMQKDSTHIDFGSFFRGCKRRAHSILLLLTAVAACAPQSSEIPLPVAVPQAFSASGFAETPDRWWTAFDDRTLNRLVETALRSNFTLETAWHRLREARAVARRESAALYPLLDAEAAGEVRRGDPEGDNQLLLGLFSEYEADLWGRINSAVEAERSLAQASLLDYRTAALSLSAEVAVTWFRLITAENQLDLIEAQLETNLKVLELIRARFGSGLVRSVDILRQQQLVEATREQKLLAEAERRVLRHQLAVLLGLPPGSDLDLPDSRLPEIPPLPATGLPLELVRQRPDIRREFHLLQAADRELAAAISDQYPRLVLTASLSTTGDGAERLFDDWLASFAGNLLAPLFDAGRREAEVDRTEAVRDQFLAAYAQTTLTAFREVEDALVREVKQAERIESLQQQVILAEQAYQRLRLEYFNGVGNYIDVLTALSDAQRLRRDLLAARRDLLEFRISLYRALAGGFTTPREFENDGAS